MTLPLDSLPAASTARAPRQAARHHGNWRYVLAIAAILAVAASVEAAMGRLAMCACGSVKLWHGVVYSAENSQHLTDWYTFTHVTHGIAFYALLWLVARRAPPRVRLVAAVLVEASWEILENSPVVIDRYRTATIALDYYGDSIVNSLSDVVAMMAGFGLARALPVRAVAALVAVMEIGLAIAIRDNLTLNILMLVHPIEAIRTWQLGA